jgi:DNA-binding transcriptional ArsR family regulator
MSRKSRGRKPDATGRSKGEEQYLPIPFSMSRSPAFRSLSGPALKVWVELRCRYNGANNGRLSLSFRQAAERLGLGKSTVARAFKELVEKGFLKLRKAGRWYGRQATEWIRKAGQGEMQGLPPPSHPDYFSVSINNQVARSLGIKLPAEAELVRELGGLP